MDTDPQIQTETRCRGCRLVIPPAGTPESTIPQFCDACTLNLKGKDTSKACLTPLDCGHLSILHASQHNKSKQLCYHAQCAQKSNFSQTEEDDCVFCSERLVLQACASLACGHLFHRDCLQKCLDFIFTTVATEPLDLSSSVCPFCKCEISFESRGYTSLETLVEKAKDVRTHIEKLTFAYLTAEGGRDGMPSNILEHGIKHFNFYKCERCESIYCGGKRECGEAPLLPGTKMLCKGCKGCSKHDEDFLSFKCRFCCKEAVWFCYGHTHFCEECHENDEYTAGENLEYIVAEIPQCAGKDKCPLGLVHPPHGEEFSWCAACFAEDQMTEQGFGEELESVFSPKTENSEKIPENKPENVATENDKNATRITDNTTPPGKNNDIIPESNSTQSEENTQKLEKALENEEHEIQEEVNGSNTEIKSENDITQQNTVEPNQNVQITNQNDITNIQLEDTSKKGEDTNQKDPKDNNTIQKEDTSSLQEEVLQKDKIQKCAEENKENENVEENGATKTIQEEKGLAYAPHKKANRKRGRKWR